nr:6-phosphogluconate dehydrogenase, decarboxylating 2-like [Populus alba]
MNRTEPDRLKKKGSLRPSIKANVAAHAAPLFSLLFSLQSPLYSPVSAEALTLNSKANTLTPLTLGESQTQIDVSSPQSRRNASRLLSGLKEERVEAAKVFKAGGFGDILTGQVVDKKHLIDDVRQALYASKICSYAQGMNLIREMSIEKGWDLKLGVLTRIWKGGCIIRAVFLDWIKKAYDRNPDLANLLVDPEFAKEIIERQSDQQFSLLKKA